MALKGTISPEMKEELTLSIKAVMPSKWRWTVALGKNKRVLQVNIWSSEIDFLGRVREKLPHTPHHVTMTPLLVHELDKDVAFLLTQIVAAGNKLNTTLHTAGGDYVPLYNVEVNVGSKEYPYCLVI